MKVRDPQPVEPPAIELGQRRVGPGNPTYLIAELSTNHGQDLDRALRTVRAMAAAGADAIKVQTYDADSMTLDLPDDSFMSRPDGLWAGMRLHELYRTGSLPLEWHARIQQEARTCGLDFFSTPFDRAAVEFLAALDVPAYKVASLEIVDIPLIRFIAARGKPIILSAGIASERDIELAVDTCHAAGNHQVVVLQCTTQYPTEPGETHLRNMSWIRDRFRVVSGLSDHSEGVCAAIATVALGASVIEKHVTLDHCADTLDDAFSLDPVEFRALVEAVRRTESMLGSTDYIYSDTKRLARRSARSLIAARDIARGEALTIDNVRSLRPNIGMPPEFLDRLMGEVAIRDIKVGEGMSWKMVDEKIRPENTDPR